MPAATDRIELAPPSDPARATSFALAVLAHLLLMLALTWGITWNREPQDLSAEAELWSSVPQEAAPAPPPAVVQAPPINTPAPPPPPAPQPKVEPPPPAPAPPKQPDIKLQQDKRRQEEARRQEEQERQQQQLEARRQQLELERRKELDARRKRDEQERLQQLEAQKKQQQEDKRKLADKKRADDLAKAKARQEQEAKVREASRQDQLARMRSLASGTGGPSATGTAQQSSGPSSSYAGRVRARVRPNIVFTDDIAGNPTAEVEVRMAPDGTIVGKRVLKSSGVAAWDDAVLRALDKTEVLPRDIDGRVPSSLIIAFRPKS